ncbi:MAG: hypothetical protein ABID54_00135 [Pseudomonadota bacterium]
MKEEGTKEIKITELTEGSPIFESNGISKVKVTKAGKIQALVFPICSTGVSELIDTYTSKAPQPPVINQVVEPNSDVGKQLKLSRRQHVKTLDFSDPAYLEAKEKHDQDLGLAIMLQGLDVPIKNKKGEEIADKGQKLAVLKGLGMTGDQFMQIVEDIQDLTKWKEDQEDSFLDVS